MKKKILAIIIVIILSTLTLCGCNNQTSIKTDDKQDLNKNKFIDQNIGEKEIFSINNSGGDFSLFDDKVKINVKSGSVDENIDITIETISNPVQDSDIVMLSCYDFGPDGTTFNRPIDLIIRFNPEDLAEGVTEKDVKIYVLKNNDWEEIEDSFGYLFLGIGVSFLRSNLPVRLLCRNKL